MPTIRDSPYIWLRENIKTMSNKSLSLCETHTQTRMGNIKKLVGWEALEESLAKDLELIWQEQKIRIRDGKIKEK